MQGTHTAPDPERAAARGVAGGWAPGSRAKVAARAHPRPGDSGSAGPGARSDPGSRRSPEPPKVLLRQLHGDEHLSHGEPWAGHPRSGGAGAPGRPEAEASGGRPGRPRASRPARPPAPRHRFTERDIKGENGVSGARGVLE